MTPYKTWVNIGSGIMACWLTHKAITSTNVDWSSAKSSDIHIRAISQEMSQRPITRICSKITCLKFHSNFPGANELTRLIPHMITPWGSLPMKGVFMFCLSYCNAVCTNALGSVITVPDPRGCSPCNWCNCDMDKDVRPSAAYMRRWAGSGNALPPVRC